MPAAAFGNEHITRPSGPPLPFPFDVTNAAFISGRRFPSGFALQRATMASSQAAPNAPKNGT
jgi:hypothetical protein